MLTRELAAEYRLLYSTDGLSGFHRAQSQRPDLILLDVLMPDLDGLAVCRLLKSEPATRDIPVIFLTACNQADQRIAGLHAGAVDFVGKPFVADEVIARVKIHLGLQARMAQAQASPARTGDAKEPARPDDPELVYLRAATALIREQLTAVPSVERLARQVGLGQRQLAGLFRRHLGMTVTAFVSEERIRVSRDLLTRTDMQVGEVSAEVGFVCVASFVAAFRERMGMTPLVWRHAQRETSP